MEFVIFDLETTGLSPKTEQIIEIAAKKVDHHGNELGLFHKFVSLYKVDEVSSFITGLTNITNQMLIDEGEDIVSVMEEFNEFIEDCVLIAQNSKFDMSFLMQHFLCDQDTCYTPLCFDTIAIAKYIKPGMKSYKLSLLVEYFNVDYDQDAHHRADYDVEITTQVFLNMLKEINFDGDLKQLLEITNFSLVTSKQESFLSSLMGKNNHYMMSGHIFSKQSASYHIDYYLNK